MSEVFQARFKVGQQLWHATFEPHEKWVKCPHCAGWKNALVVFGDGTEATVDCGECSLGFNPPSGLLKIYEHEPLAQLVEVTGISIDRNNHEGKYEVRYSLSNCRSGNEENTFENKADAEAMAIVLRDEWNKQESKRAARKDKPSDTWARNSSYHRSALKRAERDVEYHSMKLGNAKLHAKESE